VGPEESRAVGFKEYLESVGPGVSLGGRRQGSRRKEKGGWRGFLGHWAGMGVRESALRLVNKDTFIRNGWTGFKRGAK